MSNSAPTMKTVICLIICAVAVDKSLAAMEAEVVIQAGTDEHVQGRIELFQQSHDEPVQIKGSIEGLAPGLHGLHVHENGELTSACSDAGSHFNPLSTDHGAQPNLEDQRHIADLGNVVADESGTARFDMADQRQTLFEDERTIMGRAIVIHALEDDLGLGGDSESKKTGNAGARVGCGLIVMKQ
ncbi:superoxide dismutase [Cu-Zn]-like [Pollicipes pollicipes]|uniref:superoxide dismutase [Cu-Zn]-like n=1 Tax=Pollicipes pollicipes TaxID=41117 RepID=UPI001884A904|nr:superoxide dismutase [Cu-Zn]-like [Pollicipes pollicipes]